MPLKIIRQDITKIKCDAIVNPTNRFLKPDGGADLAIHNAAGEKLAVCCQKLGGCEVGQAKLTPAFKLPCKYVIHTVGPKWSCKEESEAALVSCYSESLKLALKYKCKSIAFPLIGAGAYGCPESEALSIATKVISEFMFENEMLVYLVVYDKSAFDIGQKVFFDVAAYIDDNYVQEHAEMQVRPAMLCGGCPAPTVKASKPCIKTERNFAERSVFESAGADAVRGYALPQSLDEMIKNMDKGFADTLFFYIDKKGIADVDAYKRSNVDKRTFSKIKSQKNYKPSKVTAISFAIGLKLNAEETNHLLGTAGFSLSNTILFDVIIKYFVSSGKYDNIFDVNEVLYKYDQATLGV